MNQFNQTMQQDIALTEQYLSDAIAHNPVQPDDVARAMEYSLLSGGKRIRAVLVLEFCRLFGGDPVQAVPFAAAIEMVHAYSLIHDDLPCMDDDDLRRGKPSCHIAFGEATALLAGDGLLTLAFETMLQQSAHTSGLSQENRAKAALLLAQAAGYQGMIAGQMYDLYGEHHTLDNGQIEQMYLLKTGALLRAAGKMGAVLAGADNQQLQIADDYCRLIGLAFQMIDDLLDITGDTAVLGKPVGSDAKKQKSTLVAAYGIKRTRQLALQYMKEAKQVLAPLQGAQFLLDLADLLANRQS